MEPSCTLHVHRRDAAGEHAPGRNDLVSWAKTGYRTLGGAWCGGRLLCRNTPMFACVANLLFWFFVLRQKRSFFRSFFIAYCVATPRCLRASQISGCGYLCFDRNVLFFVLFYCILCRNTPCLRASQISGCGSLCFDRNVLFFVLFLLNTVSQHPVFACVANLRLWFFVLRQKRSFFRSFFIEYCVATPRVCVRRKSPVVVLCASTEAFFFSFYFIAYCVATPRVCVRRKSPVVVLCASTETFFFSFFVSSGRVVLLSRSDLLCRWAASSWQFACRR